MFDSGAVHVEETCTMSEMIGMVDFFIGNCVAVREQRKFVQYWVKTNRNPLGLRN